MLNTHITGPAVHHIYRTYFLTFIHRGGHVFQQIACIKFTRTNTWELPSVTTVCCQLLSSSTGAARSQKSSLKSTLTVVRAEESATHWFYPTASSLPVTNVSVLPQGHKHYLNLWHYSRTQVRYHLQLLFMVCVNPAFMISLSLSDRKNKWVGVATLENKAHPDHFNRWLLFKYYIFGIRSDRAISLFYGFDVS